MPTVQARAMRRAAEICGEEQLARRLGVTTRTVRFWMSGMAVPPGDVFLKVADILGDHALEKLKQPRPDTTGV
jgi:DNA-binding transcriptional regulator YiaG